MSRVSDVLAAEGGIASSARLRAAGVSAAEEYRATARGEVVRVRQGWLALGDAPNDVVSAVRVGGRLSCVSVLRAEGLWCAVDRRLHVRVAATCRRLSSPHDRRTPLHDPSRFGVVVHRSRPASVLAEPEGPVDTFGWALLHAIVCQSRLDAICTLDSALQQKRITRTELEFLVAELPAKYRAYLEFTDASAASGLETKARLGLRRHNLRVRSQVRVDGVGRVDLVVGDRLVIETDGQRWHTKTEAYLEDRRRDLALTGLDYHVLRLSYAQVMGEWDAVARVVLGLVARNEHRWSTRHTRAGLGGDGGSV